jgi:oligopeptide transport system permease protein
MSSSMKLIKGKLMPAQKIPAAVVPAGEINSDFQLKKDTASTKIDVNFASVGYWKEVRIRFFSNKGAVISLAAIIVIMFFAFLGPKMTGYTYSGQNLAQKNYAPRLPGFDNAPVFNGCEKLKTTTGVKELDLYKSNGDANVYYWFGSDTLGRDIWTRTWMGTRVSLYISIVAVLIDMIIGLSYGLVSGYFGGLIDSLMQRFSEIVNGIPRLVIVTLLMLILKPGIATIIFALMITEWIGMSRIARAEILNLKEREFVLASRTLGASSFAIIFHEILPNIVGQVITQTMFSIPTAIFTEAFLSFVGLGIPVPQCSLGSLISDAFNSFTTHPYQILPPIIVLAILMLSFNVLADGLREALDPKFKDQ